MRINTNLWNKIRYTLYAPGYDIAGKLLNKSRKRSIEKLNLQPNNLVLIVGAGTGLDLQFLPHNCQITATDITPLMVKKITHRSKRLNIQMNTLVMDGQALKFANNSFDVVILHLIVSVIPDPIACIKEAERVVKPGGSIAVFDKFLPKNTKISFKRKVLNVFTNFLFSNINRSFETIVASTNLQVILDEDADFNGNFRVIKLQKPPLS